VWPRLPLLDGRSFRDLVEWRGVPLVFAAEAFLHDATSAPGCARTVELCLRLLDATEPAEVDVSGLPAAVAVLLARACTARRVLFHEPPGTAPALRPASTPRPSGSAWRSLLRGGPPVPATVAGPPSASRPLLAITADSVHASALEALLSEGGARRALPVALTTTGALERAPSRRVRRAVKEAKGSFRGRLLQGGAAPALRESYAHRGVGFADLAGADLEALLLGRCVEAVGEMEACLELIEASRPAGLLLVVPGRDERRAFLAAAQVAGVGVLDLRLGPLEPHDAFRADGGPRPEAALGWTPGSDPDELVARLDALVRGRVEAQ
jgi:hypothetical protein